ncbi:hypothetical protein PIB30_069053 [Stylosanthes scabra]|uniref:Transmembrane protein n=1 Tax=Stylosanthes scabra TaxID=79078 RepID=A0ABU6ZLR8_9FABA|nr:hypothetical protein [Stylosanthes scabra]
MAGVLVTKHPWPPKFASERRFTAARRTPLYVLVVLHFVAFVLVLQSAVCRVVSVSIYALCSFFVLHLHHTAFVVSPLSSVCSLCSRLFSRSRASLRHLRSSLLVRSSPRQSPSLFVPGALCLDFCNSAAYAASISVFSLGSLRLSCSASPSLLKKLKFFCKRSTYGSRF